MRISDWSSDVCSSDLNGAEPSLYLAARKNAGRFEAALFNAQGHDQRVVPLPGRGHSFAIDAAQGRVVAFGRQPGFFAMAFDTAGKRPPQQLAVAPGRHFFGHGVFSPDRSEEHTSELQSLMRISYAVFCLKKKQYSTL